VTETSYTAWDDKLYQWPPPEGWYKADDGRWWPEGYGPGPVAEASAADAPPDRAEGSWPGDADRNGSGTVGSLAGGGVAGGMSGFADRLADAADDAASGTGSTPGFDGWASTVAEEAPARAGDAVGGFGDPGDLGDRSGDAVGGIGRAAAEIAGETSELPDGFSDLVDSAGPEEAAGALVDGRDGVDAGIDEVGDALAETLAFRGLEAEPVDTAFGDDPFGATVGGIDTEAAAFAPGDDDVDAVLPDGDSAATRFPSDRAATPGSGFGFTAPGPEGATDDAEDADGPLTDLDALPPPTVGTAATGGFAPFGDEPSGSPSDLADADGSPSSPVETGFEAPFPPPPDGSAPDETIVGPPPGGFDAGGSVFPPPPAATGQFHGGGDPSGPGAEPWADVPLAGPSGPPTDFDQGPPPPGGFTGPDGPAWSQPTFDPDAPAADFGAGLDRPSISSTGGAGFSRTVLVAGLGVLFLVALGFALFLVFGGGDDEASDDTSEGALGNPHARTTGVEISYEAGDSDRLWVVEVLEPVRDASADGTTSAPGAGDAFAATRVRVRNQAVDLSAPLGELKFNAVTADGDVIDREANACTVSADPFDFAAALPPSGTIEGTVCWEVPVESLGGLLLGIESTEVTGRVHIRLQ
jgi:hypothetical protein